MRVLVADDEVDFRESLIEILQIKGHEAFGVGSVGAFNALLNSVPFDLAVVDRMLPDGDGLQILRSIRQACDVPIVLITGSTEFDANRLGRENTPDLCIAKPFTVQPLLNFIEQMKPGI